ncbi:MAG TPA: hypothetical protein VI322_03960 [Candidatus Saccharimonadia bacterium]
MPAKSTTKTGRFFILIGMGAAFIGLILMFNAPATFLWGAGLVVVGALLAGWDRVFRHLFTFSL